MCSSHRNGGEHACANDLSVGKLLAEGILLPRIEQELPSPDALALAERIAREQAATLQREVRDRPKQRRAAVARLDQQIAGLERLLRDGTLSPAVAGAALEKARADRKALDAAGNHVQERALDKVVRLLPRVAEAYRRQIRSLLSGRAHEKANHAARAALREQVGGPVQLIPDESGRYLLADVAPSRSALLQAAGGRVWNGSRDLLPIRATPCSLRLRCPAPLHPSSGYGVDRQEPWCLQYPP